MNKSESIKEIATSLCKFQGEIAKIPKTETNPFYKNKYADLSSILDVVQKPLSECGLAVCQFPKDKYGLETILMHVSGEWMSESFEMKPTKDDPQGAGSVITYQRRYALGAILGLNIDKDDDGNKGSEPVKPEAKPTAESKVTDSKPNEDKIIITASEFLKSCKTVPEIVTLYESYPALKDSKVFIKMCADKKRELTPKNQ